MTAMRESVIAQAAGWTLWLTGTLLMFDGLFTAADVVFVAAGWMFAVGFGYQVAIMRARRRRWSARP